MLLPTDESPMITAYLARLAALVNGVSGSDCAGYDWSQRSTSKPFWRAELLEHDLGVLDRRVAEEPSLLLAMTRTLNFALGVRGRHRRRHVRVARLARVALGRDAEVGRGRRVRDAADLARDVLGVGDRAGCAPSRWRRAPRTCETNASRPRRPRPPGRRRRRRLGRGQRRAQRGDRRRPGSCPPCRSASSSASMSANDVVTRNVNVTLLPLPALSVRPSVQVCLPSESCEASSGSG